MTFFAGQGCVGTGQRKFTAVVIKVNMIPAGGVMTGRTVCAKIPIVIIVFLMTGITIHRRAFELLIDVA